MQVGLRGHGETDILLPPTTQQGRGASRLLPGLPFPAFCPPTSRPGYHGPGSRETLPAAEPSVNVRAHRGSSPLPLRKQNGAVGLPETLFGECQGPVAGL